MKKLISTILLVVIGYIVSYLLGIGEHHRGSECKPYKQENSLIKIDLADNDDDEENGELHVKNTAKPKQPDKEST
jgi:hypothetical protein